MARFGKGNPGRPAGSKNKATREIQDAARTLLSRPEYLQSLQERLDKGTAPHMETLLHHYGWGKPKDTLAVESMPPVMVVDELTPEDVAAQLRERDA